MAGRGELLKTAWRASPDRNALHMQGADNWRAAKVLLGQGATEYLILLAAVLIVALVSISLLGFFPGTASDMLVLQSQEYWQIARPVAIIESLGRGETGTACNAHNHVYLRIKNNGPDPITITKIIAGNSSISELRLDTNGVNTANISSRFADIAPGAEAYFSNPDFYGLPLWQDFAITDQSTIGGGCAGSSYWLFNVKSICGNSSSGGKNPYGYAVVNNFGFEYIVRIGGATITKRQVGTAPLLVKCSDPGLG